MINLSTVVQQKEDLVASELDDGLVVLDIDSGQYFSFNHTAKIVWERVQEPIEVGQLITQLQETYKSDKIKEDVLAVLQTMETGSLLKVS
jgi:hypothetical protein